MTFMLFHLIIHLQVDTENCAYQYTAYVPLSSATYYQFRLDAVYMGTYRNQKGWQVGGFHSALGTLQKERLSFRILALFWEFLNVIDYIARQS